MSDTPDIDALVGENQRLRRSLSAAYEAGHKWRARAEAARDVAEELAKALGTKVEWDEEGMPATTLTNKRAKAAEQALREAREVIELQERYMVCQRIGKNPGALIDKLRAAKERLANLPESGGE